MVICWGIWVLFKVACICRMVDSRDNGSLHTTVVEIVPVDTLKKWMGFYSSGTARYVPQSFCWVGLAEQRDDILSCPRHVLGESQTTLNDLFVDSHWILVPERRLSNQELVYQDS